MTATKKVATTLLSYITALLLSCDGSEHGIEATGGELVIEGWIDSDGHPNVIFTRTIKPTTQGGNLEDAIIKWGTIEISDRDQTIILTGHYDSDYFPPYRYTTTKMWGEPGHTYSIKATYNGTSVSAVSKMPPKPEVDSIAISNINGTDSLLTATLHMTSPADCPAYYHLSTAVAENDTRLYPAMFGSFALNRPNEKAEIPIYRGKNISDTTKFTPQWRLGTTMIVRVERIDEVVYRFWQAFDETVLFGNSPFVGSSNNLPTMVNGGLGYFSAQGTRTFIMPVQEGVLIENQKSSCTVRLPPPW